MNKIKTPTQREMRELHAILERNVFERTQDLEQSRANNEAVLTSIGDGLVVVDKQGKITHINKSFEEMLGWKAEEVVGKSMVEVVPREDVNGVKVQFKEQILTQVLAGKKFVANVLNPFYYIRKDKTRFPVSSVIAPVVLKSKIVGAVEVFRDITREREMDKVKTEFVSLASHQLRTPLSAVNWYSEMLLAGDAGEVTSLQRKYIEEIYNGNLRMVDLVNTLLDVSRIELGTFTMESKPIDVIKLTKEIIKEHALHISEKQIRFSSTFGKKIFNMQVDPKILSMVVHNLLSNAIKYTAPRGKVHIAISFKKKNHILFTFSDTGYGIPKKQQDKIFTKLFRADNVIGKDTQGTGLGLYIAKSIVEQCGGKIWFNSKENKGTTFFAELPVKKRGKAKN